MKQPRFCVSSPWLQGAYALVPIVLLAALRGLWAPDEPRYAEVAREVWEHDAVVMHLNGELYGAKPPLVYWLAALMGALSGWSELALRVPSLVATLVGALLARRLARELCGDAVAAWAPLLFLATPMVLEIGGRLQLDPTLTAACLASVTFAHEARRGTMSRTRGLLLAGICAGLGALAKGPPAWLHVGVGILSLELVVPRGEPRVRGAWKGWTGFVLLAVLPVLAWATSAALLQHARTGEWSYFRALFFGEHVGRVLDGTQHAGPPWQHLVRFPLLFLPWTPLLVIALAGAARDLVAWRRGSSDFDRARLALALWFSIEFVVFSAMPPKRDLYLLPIYPAAAILSAHALVAGARVRWLGASAALFALVGSLIAIGALALAFSSGGGFLPGASAEIVALVRPRAWWIWALGLALGAGGLAGWRAIRRGSAQGGAQHLALGLCAAVALGACVLVPLIDPLKSARELGLWLAARPEKPSAIACVGVQPEGYRFYGGVPAVKESVETALEREGDQFLALVTERDYARLSETVRARTRVLDSRAVGSREVVVLGAAR